MAVSKQARKRAVAAGVVIAMAMIVGTFSVPVHAADQFHVAFAPSPTPETSSSSDGLTPCPLFVITGLLIISIASLVQNGLKIELF